MMTKSNEQTVFTEEQAIAYDIMNLNGLNDELARIVLNMCKEVETTPFETFKNIYPKAVIEDKIYIIDDNIEVVWAKYNYNTTHWTLYNKDTMTPYSNEFIDVYSIPQRPFLTLENKNEGYISVSYGFDDDLVNRAWIFFNEKSLEEYESD